MEPDKEEKSVDTGRREDSKDQTFEKFPAREFSDHFEVNNSIENIEEKLRVEQKRKSALVQLAQCFVTQRDIYYFYNAIIMILAGEINSLGVFLMRIEDNRLYLKSHTGDTGIKTMKILESSDILSKVIKEGQSLNLGELDSELLDRQFAGAEDRVNSLLCAPLKTSFDTRPSGLIGLVNKQSGGDYSRDEERFVSLIANISAMAFKYLESTRYLEKKQDELVFALVRTIEAKDEYTHDHSNRVKKLSEKLAKVLGLPAEEVELVKKAAILHDLGIIAISDSILRKEGSLDEKEWKEMKEHTTRAVNILKSVSTLEKEILDMVLYHHERYDGKGYPAGLKGDQIPIGARIIAVAETFDALTTDRSYRKRIPISDALEKMRRECSGTQHDPYVLEVFLKIMSKSEISKYV